MQLSRARPRLTGARDRVNALKIIIAALLVAINAFFVIAEYALVRSRRTRLEQMRDEGIKGARLALEQLSNINEYISAVQIGVTLTSIGIGALGEPALANVLESALGSALAHGAAVVIAAIVAFTIISSAQLVAGEMVPKFYAIDRAESVARRVARPLRAFSILFHPVIVVLTAVADRILRLLGVDMDEERRGGSPDELKRLIAESQAGGHIDLGEAGMLAGVFHLHEQDARQVMTPIPAVVTVDASQDVETALQLCVSSGHTRLVVTEADDRDRVRGIVHANTLVQQLMEEGPRAPIEPLVHDAPIVPETKPLDDLLADLQRERTSMAVIVDEYGRVVGIVTVEDIIEEVVGEIADETDPAGGEVRRLANGDWFVRGHVAVTDLVDYGLHLPVDTDAYNSIGGLVFAQLGRLPRRGDSVNVNGFSIRVESVRDNRVEAVRIRERRAVPTNEGRADRRDS
ncbi:MAG: magnesium and cobalt exporter, family [Solirubrobacteraceae bacterium]|nr:magnesium and cobalt exporter, family [Solirubrobacteraceae bacterium]